MTNPITPEDKIDAILDDLLSKTTGWKQFEHNEGFKYHRAEARHALLALLNEAAPDNDWWVTDKDNDVRVSGPYSTDRDAGLAREIIERHSGNVTYWLERKPIHPRRYPKGEHMNIYLVSRSENDYDEYDAFVIAAPNEQEALAYPENKYHDPYIDTWPDVGTKTAELIGTTDKYTEVTEILGSFHAS